MIKKATFIVLLLISGGCVQAQDTDTLPFNHPRALSFGTDLSRLPWFLFGAANESFVRYEPGRHLAYKMAAGFSRYQSDTVFTNVSSYVSSGWYLKPGVQYIFKVLPEWRANIGLSYIISNYKEEGSVVVNSPFWNTKVLLPFEMSSSLSALELEAAAEYGLSKRWIVSAAIRYRMLLGDNAPATDTMFTSASGKKYESYHVPGIGFPYSSNQLRGFGFALNLSYRIPFDKKP